MTCGLKTCLNISRSAATLLLDDLDDLDDEELELELELAAAPSGG